MKTIFISIFLLVSATVPLLSSSSQRLIGKGGNFEVIPFNCVIEKVFPVLELPKEIDGPLDPSLTSGLPTVVVRGFMNYMTIVDGVVIKFTKSSQIKPTQAHTFPVLLIPSSVDSTTTFVKPTESINETELMLALDKRTGQLHVSEKQHDLIKTSLSSQNASATDTVLNYSSNIPDQAMNASDKSRVSLIERKIKCQCS